MDESLILNWFTLYYIQIRTQTNRGKSQLLISHFFLSFAVPNNFIDIEGSSLSLLKNSKFLFNLYMYLDIISAKQYLVFESMDPV